VISINHDKKDEKGEETATIMRDDYQQLYDRMRQADFDPVTLSKRDYARFLVGAIIVVQQIETRIENEKKAISGYKIDLIPKLERIINEIKEGEEDKLPALISELFEIKPEEKTETNSSNEEKVKEKEKSNN
jgi:hypothetical protein